MIYTIAFIVTRIFWLASLIIKEWGVFVGLVEQMIKILVGITSLTPTREDDEVIQYVEDLFDRIQEKIYGCCTKIVEFYNNVWIKIVK